MKIGYIYEIKRISKAGKQKAKQKINFLGTNNRNYSTEKKIIFKEINEDANAFNDNKKRNADIL